MVDMKTLTLFLHLMIVKLCPIIGDQNLWNPKFANDVLIYIYIYKDLVGDDIC